MSNVFGRVLTAMVTPFNNDKSINWQQVKDLAEYLVDNGSDGLVVCGTTGESPTLTHDEKLKLFQVVLETVGDRAKVIAGTGSNNTRASIQLSQEAENLGVHGVMLVVPYYNKPPQEALYRHFRDIAGQVDLPVMLYNVPSRTGSNLLPDTVARLALLENIVALKEAAGNMDQVSILKTKLPGDFAVYGGDDSLTLPMLSLGCRGVVSVASHLVGRELQEMITAFTAGDVFKADSIHRRLFPLFKALFITTNPVPVKAALNFKGMQVGGPRPPLIEANSQEQKIIKEAMVALGLIR